MFCEESLGKINAIKNFSGTGRFTKASGLGTSYSVSIQGNFIFFAGEYINANERCPVALFKSFVERRPLLKHWPCDGLFFLPE